MINQKASMSHHDQPPARQPDQDREYRGPFEVYAWSSHEIRARQPWYSDQSESLKNMLALAEQMRDSGRWLAVRLYADDQRDPLWSWTVPGRHVELTWSTTGTYSHTFPLADYVDAGEDGLHELVAEFEDNEHGAFNSCTERQVTRARPTRRRETR